jgi:hypothetical protein
MSGQLLYVKENKISQVVKKSNLNLTDSKPNVNGKKETLKTLTKKMLNVLLNVFSLMVDLEENVIQITKKLHVNVIIKNLHVMMMVLLVKP